MFKRYQKAVKVIGFDTKMVWCTVMGVYRHLFILFLLKSLYPKFTVSSIKSKKAVIEKLTVVNLSHEGPLAVCKERLAKHQKAIVRMYQQSKCEENVILFYDGQNINCYHPDATFIDPETMYVAFGRERFISLCLLKFNCVGLESTCSRVVDYDANWKDVTEIEVMGRSLIVSYNTGVSLMDLESVIQILANYHLKSLAAYKDGFLFPYQQCSYH